MQKYALSALISSIVALAMQSNASAQVTPQGVIGQLGTVQQQDLDSAKRLEQEERNIRDYENLQSGQKQKAKRTAAKKEKL